MLNMTRNTVKKYKINKFSEGVPDMFIGKGVDETQQVKGTNSSSSEIITAENHCRSSSHSSEERSINRWGYVEVGHCLGKCVALM